MNSDVTQKNTVGRPAGRDGDRVRSDLLEAARSLFLKSEFKAVSLRQLAETAGVNAAMVNYYFGGKQGLYLAMIEELLSGLETSLSDIGNSETLTIADFSRSYSQVLLENPWWPNFLIREVLFGEGETRQAVMQRFASSFGPRLMGSIGKEIETGSYRQDLDPAMTMISLMGMTIFPFLTRPVLETVLNVRIDQNFVDKLATHNSKLFHEGVLASGNGESRS